jgi:hypothetical protein
MREEGLHQAAIPAAQAECQLPSPTLSGFRGEWEEELLLTKSLLAAAAPLATQAQEVRAATAVPLVAPAWEVAAAAAMAWALLAEEWVCMEQD